MVILFRKIKSNVKNKIISSEKKLVLNNENYEILKKISSKTGIKWNELYYMNANKYFTCLEIFDYMEESGYGFLNSIISLENCLVSCDCSHVDRMEYNDRFEKIIKKHENEQDSARKFKIYKNARQSVVELNEFDDEIAFNNDSVKTITVRVYIYDDTLEKLQERLNKVINQLARISLRGFIQTNNLIQDVRALTRFDDSVQKMVSSSTVADMLMRSEINKIDEDVALIGYTRNGLYAPDFYSFENYSYNKIFIGGMGSGKSALLKSIGESTILGGSHIAHIFDIHEEYDDYAKQLDISVFDFNENQNINFMQMFYVDNDKGVITKSDVQTKIDGIIETVKSVNDITKETVVKQLKLLLTDFYDIYLNRKLEDISSVEWFLLEDVLNKLTENKKLGLYESIALEDIYNLELSLRDMVVSYGYIFNRITNIDFDLTKSLVYNISSFKGLDKKVKSSYVSLLLDYEMSAVYLNQKRNYGLMKEKDLELSDLKRPLITHEIIIDETMQYTDDKGFLNKVLELMKYQRKCFSGSTFVIHATDDINKNLENNGDLLSQLFELTTNKFIVYTTGKSLTTLPVLIPQLNKNDCKLISTFSKGKNNERTFFVFDDKKRKIIYAASFGKETLKKYEAKRYGEFLKELQYVSVREETAQKLVSKISGREPELVLDPTLLRPYEYWKKKADTSKKKYTNYIFCYFLNLTKEKIEESQRYAERNNCKIVMIPYLHDREDEMFGDIQDTNVAPNDFLKLIENSTAVLTDSFHATVFSLIFNKEFWVFGRNSGSYNMNTRIDNILKLYNATERLIKPQELAVKKRTDCLYNTESVEKAKEHSLVFLKQALQK